ncbi:MAG TPA: EthD family reductase [Vicinamibacterales bacterium]|nr:EthD family reductase [Vicinamibacterales bacterium]
MAGAKIIVLYPTPTDATTFERTYAQEHAPMVTAENFKGITRFVGSRVVGTPDGSPAPFARIAELHFSSMQALQAAAGSPEAQKVVAHAVSISSGGMPVILVAEEETKTF